MGEFHIIEEIQNGEENIYAYVEEDAGRKVYLNSTFSPFKEAEKFVKHLNSNEFNIIIGVGNGTIIKELQNKSGIHYLIIEPFDDIKLSKDIQEIVNQNEKISFFYFKDITSLIISEFIKRNIGIRTNISIHPKYEKTNKLLIDKVLNVIHKGIMVVQINKNTEQYFKKAWILEPLLNLKYTLNLPSVNNLENYFEGETALLVASGPSLHDHIPFLKAMSRHAFIFAAGSALNGLLSKNITPDFVTVIDSSPINYTAHFKDTKYDGPLIISGMVNSQILEKFHEKAILADFVLDSITRRFRPEVTTFAAVPSVSVFTLQLIYYLGFSKVYLIGQDLALSNGEYYASGVKVHQGTNHFHSQLLVESNSGSKVGTLYSLYAHLQSFNDLIKLFDKEKLKIYNLSRNGAKIEGAEYISAETIQIPEKVKKELPENFMCKGNRDSVTIVKEFIKDFSKTMDVVDEIKHKLNKINNSAVNRDDLLKVLKLFKKLRSQEIVESVVLQQMTFLVQKINNKFEHHFDKEILSNDDRVEMVNDIKKLVGSISEYMKEILEDDRLRIYIS